MSNDKGGRAVFQSSTLHPVVDRSGDSGARSFAGTTDIAQSNGHRSSRSGDHPDGLGRGLDFSQGDQSGVADLDLPPQRARAQLLLAHMHDAGHERMHGADIAKVTFAGKGMLELVVGIQTFRGKTLVAAGHGMRRFVVIYPDDLGAGCDRDFLRPVRELRDIDIDDRWG